jgi:hypothetical protein
LAFSRSSSLLLFSAFPSIFSCLCRECYSLQSGWLSSPAVIKLLQQSQISVALFLPPSFSGLWLIWRSRPHAGWDIGHRWRCLSSRSLQPLPRSRLDWEQANCTVQCLRYSGNRPKPALWPLM